MNILSLLKFTIILIFCFSKISISEPFVVLEYRGQIDRGDNSSDNLFLRDLNYSSKHTVLKNETLPGLLKIGYTKLTPDQRAKQISNATGVPLPYKVAWAFRCFNGELLESEVHHALRKYRVNNQREFFQISLNEAKQTIESIGKNFK